VVNDDRTVPCLRLTSDTAAAMTEAADVSGVSSRLVCLDRELTGVSRSAALRTNVVLSITLFRMYRRTHDSLFRAEVLGRRHRPISVTDLQPPIPHTGTHVFPTSQQRTNLLDAQLHPFFEQSPLRRRLHTLAKPDRMAQEQIGRFRFRQIATRRRRQ